MRERLPREAVADEHAPARDVAHPLQPDTAMPDVTLSDDVLRALLARALGDALDERRDLLREVVAEALEDAALAEAVRDGRESPLVARADVLDALRGDAA